MLRYLNFINENDFEEDRTNENNIRRESFGIDELNKKGKFTNNKTNESIDNY